MLPSGVLEGACPVSTAFSVPYCCDGSGAHLFDRHLGKPFVCLPRKSVHHHQAGSVRAVISEPSASDNAGDSAADFVKRAERAWMISKVSGVNLSLCSLIFGLVIESLGECMDA